MHLTHTPYTPYTHPLCALRAPLMCLMHIPYVLYAHPLHALRALGAPLTCLTCTPYVPYVHPLCTLRAPLMCLTCTPYGPYMHPLHALHAPLTRLMCTPYVHPLQDSDWLISPPHPIRSMELNNLINIKSWFFPHHLMRLTCLMHHTRLTHLTCTACRNLIG